MEGKETGKVSVQDKLQTAKQFKVDGNTLYKAKNYRGAAGKYHRAILYLKAIEADSKSVLNFGPFQGPVIVVPESIKTESLELKADCYNNLAASLLQQSNADLDKIITYCQYVLEIHPGNDKAWFRKGQAQFQQRNFEAALESFCHLPIDAAAKKFAEMCRVELAKQSASEKVMYQNVFSKLSCT